MEGDRLRWPLEGLNKRMARAGQRHNVDWLVYNPIEFYRWHIYASTTSQAFVDSVLQTFSDAHSFADVGAGTGTYAAALKRRGKHVVACENALFGRMFSYGQRVRSHPFNLGHSSPARLPLADVAYCLEVAEHLPPESGERLIEFLARYPTVLFSAAHPGQGGTAHVNEQPQGYWIERFQKHGMTVDALRSGQIVKAFRSSAAPWWLIDNAMVFGSDAAK